MGFASRLCGGCALRWRWLFLQAAGVRCGLSLQGRVVGVERLDFWPEALLKMELAKHDSTSQDADLIHYFLLIQDRGRTERVPLLGVLYLKSELKYLTVRTLLRHYIFSGSLAALEARHPGHFIRIHRNTLVARHAVEALKLQTMASQPACWTVQLAGVDEQLPVSRRQHAAVWALLNPCCASPPQCR